MTWLPRLPHCQPLRTEHPGTEQITFELFVHSPSTLGHDPETVAAIYPSPQAGIPGGAANSVLTPTPNPSARDNQRHPLVCPPGLRLKLFLINRDDHGGQPACFRNTYGKGCTPHGLGGLREVRIDMAARGLYDLSMSVRISQRVALVRDQ